MKLNNTYRKKLLNAIIFFIKNVKIPSKVKIFKLLYFLDFKHFQETGKSVTNLDYHALNWGPVPLSLYSEVKDNEVPNDFEKYILIDEFKSESGEKKGGIFKVRSKVLPNLKVFTPREKRILEELVEIYKDVDAQLISDISHFKNHPWDKTRKEKGENQLIDYMLSLDNDAKISFNEASDYIQERKEMLENFPLINDLNNGKR